MKNIFICLFAVISTTIYSQDYLDKIALESCGCLDRISDTLNNEQFYLEFGVCMLIASEPYKKQLKKEHDIDLKSFDEANGEKLGILIGSRLAIVCPEKLLKLSERSVEDNTKAQETFEVIGEVTSISKELFVTFTIKSDNRTMKYVWLTQVSTNIDLAMEYENLLNKKVKATYVPDELFDPKINEYRKHFILLSIEKID